jgi:hypothetical protein
VALELGKDRAQAGWRPCGCPFSKFLLGDVYERVAFGEYVLFESIEPLISGNVKYEVRIRPRLFEIFIRKSPSLDKVSSEYARVVFESGFSSKGQRQTK